MQMTNHVTIGSGTLGLVLQMDSRLEHASLINLDIIRTKFISLALLVNKFSLNALVRIMNMC